MKSKFLQFATSSFMGFLIDYALFCGLSFLFPDTENYILLANAAARVVSAICNYTINCRLVFKEKPTVKSAASYFALTLQQCGIYTLTIGSIFRGVLDIYGTINQAGVLYWIAGWGLVIIGGIIQFIFKKRFPIDY